MMRSLSGLRKAILLALLALGAALPPGAQAAQRDALATPPGATTAAQASGAEQEAVDTDNFHDGIVAIVNDRPISEYDLSQRVALVMTTSNIPQTPEMKKKIHDQVLEQLETELIQRQEALKNDVTVSSVDVDKEINHIITDNHMTLDQLKNVLARGRVQMATLRAQIAAQILWQKAVQQEYAGRINISPEAVNAEMARMAEGANRTHYIVSEIFLSVDNPELDGKVLSDAQSLDTQIQGGAPFAAIARQFSQSPSAADGGDIGLVYDGQLAPELNQALAKMKTGDVSAPIRSTGGYYILHLQQRLEAVGTKIVAPAPETALPPGEMPLGRILLPLGPNPAPTLTENAMKIAQSLRANISGCQLLPKLPQQLKGSLYFDLGMTKLSDLSQQIRDVLSKSEPGSVAEPFVSAAGIEIFVRCDKPLAKQEAYQLPTRDQVEEQLFEEQISALARRYSRDLKRNADIEVR